MESVPGNDRQFLMAFREDIESLTINFRLEEIEDIFKLMRGVTSRSVKNLEIVNLESVIDFEPWETGPSVQKLHRFMSTLHIKFPGVISLQLDHRPKNPMYCHFTGGLRGRFRNLKSVTWLGIFEYDDWSGFIDAHYVRGGAAFFFNLEFVPRGKRFID